MPAASQAKAGRSFPQTLARYELSNYEKFADGFDPQAEAALLGERLIRRTAGLIAAGDNRDIVSALCATLTHETRHIRLAWTWFGNSNTTTIRPQIVSGPASAYASSLTIEDTPLTRSGPAYQALTGRRTAPSAVTAGSSFEPWRRAATDFGIRSALALSLRSTDEHERGIFVLYANRTHYFEEVGLPLFESLAELFGALLSAASDRDSLRVAARSDALTGLGNRHMAPEIERSVYRFNEVSAQAVVLLLDLDHFKAVNDEHGHEEGDNLLKNVARLLRNGVRSNDCVLRWGGEEFLVCLPNTTLDQGLIAAEKIRAAVSNTVFGDKSIRATVSIGVAEMLVNTSLGAVIRRADEALYAAKRAGRNCTRTWQEPT